MRLLRTLALATTIGLGALPLSGAGEARAQGFGSPYQGGGFSFNLGVSRGNFGFPGYGYGRGYGNGYGRGHGGFRRGGCYQPPPRYCPPPRPRPCGTGYGYGWGRGYGYGNNRGPRGW